MGSVHTQSVTELIILDIQRVKFAEKQRLAMNWNDEGLYITCASRIWNDANLSYTAQQIVKPGADKQGEGSS